MLNLTAPYDLDLAQCGLAFSLAADGTLSLREPGAESKELGRLEGRSLRLSERLLGTIMVAADEWDACELLLNGEVVHSSHRGFRLEIHGNPSGMSLVDLDGHKPIYHSYGSIWRPYNEEKQRKVRLSGLDLELRSRNYLSALSSGSGPRLRPSGLAA